MNSKLNTENTTLQSIYYLRSNQLKYIWSMIQMPTGMA